MVDSKKEYEAALERVAKRLLSTPPKPHEGAKSGGRRQGKKPEKLDSQDKDDKS
jgi:hypothetical protein